MQYIFLRGIIESTLANFSCPECQTRPGEQSLEITAVSSERADIYVHCPKCHISTHLHAEINSIASELIQNEHGQKFLNEFLKKGGNISAQFAPKPLPQKPQYIKEGDISHLATELEKAQSIEDILGKGD